MKSYLILISLFLTFSSCGSSKKVIESQTKETKKIIVIKEIDTVKKTEPILPKENNSVELSLGQDGTVSDNGISETTEVIYIESFDHSIFNDLLKKHVSINGNVDYKSFKKDAQTLQNYITKIKTYQPNASWTKNDKLAYWINTYNALTVDLILRNHPIKSIKDIKDPWGQRLWKFGDKWQNLNDIEHQILRKMDEPRIHFAIVCASVSCPKLQNNAFTASNLDAQLTAVTKEFLNDESKNKFSENRIELSKIFKWFKKDFEQNGSLIDFLNTYSDFEISNNAKKNYTNYNWNLND